VFQGALAREQPRGCAHPTQRHAALHHNETGKHKVAAAAYSLAFIAARLHDRRHHRRNCFLCVQCSFGGKVVAVQEELHCVLMEAAACAAQYIAHCVNAASVLEYHMYSKSSCCQTVSVTDTSSTPAQTSTYCKAMHGGDGGGMRYAVAVSGKIRQLHNEGSAPARKMHNCLCAMFCCLWHKHIPASKQDLRVNASVQRMQQTLPPGLAC
jgi:hypothetical protein